ncbi:hypothetical protein [Candidatus Parabeggiatoa sp. HSG14]|uniref:hypothetical protein n=1 Tax=Candidatus Parabeggiatoa sp. HSG14 TaxID=3055593 RepID=UPI0025A7DE9C|nr:hypothetical protein [Thiotrichales bacterium HSG14]
MNFYNFIALLTKEDLEEITKEFNKLKNEIPIYTFSQIEHKDLRKLFDIERVFDNKIFNAWFNSDIILKDEEVLFLKALLSQEIDLIRIYNEEDLKVHFISPILNRINFKSIKNKTRDFYEETLIYETDNFILKGITDFVVAKGLEYPEKPYFFIQEFKKGLQYSNPEPQLLAELISAIELNNFKQMKGAFIVGENWNFVILDKLAQDKYQYFISRTFNATNINDLEGIYKNLLFVKQELFKEKIK